MGGRFILCGILVLISSAFIDSARGPLLPVFVQTLGIRYSEVSYFLILGGFAGVFSALALLPLVRRLGEGGAAVAVCVTTLVVAPLGFLVKAPWALYLLGFLVGSCVSALGAMANLLVIKGSSHHSRGRMLALLHMTYGLGALMAPIAAQAVLEAGLKWPFVFFLVAPFALVSALTAKTLPREESEVTAAPISGALGVIDVIIILMMGIYVAGEVATSMWMVSYLVTERGMSVISAANYSSLFFFFMLGSRASCLIPLSEKGELTVLVSALVLGTVFAIIGQSGWPIALAATGVLGPYFPLLLARISRYFPGRSQSLTVWILAFVAFMLCMMHLCMGKLSDAMGVARAYWIAPGFLIVGLGLLSAYLYLEKKQRAHLRVDEGARCDALV